MVALHPPRPGALSEEALALLAELVAVSRTDEHLFFLMAQVLQAGGGADLQAASPPASLCARLRSRLTSLAHMRYMGVAAG